MQRTPDSTLVPELSVTDLQISRRFWCGLLGFAVLYERSEEGFAFLTREGARFMLEESGKASRTRVTAALEPPLGRGINFQIMTSSIAPLVAALRQAKWPLFLEPEEKWYRVGD